MQLSDWTSSVQADQTDDEQERFCNAELLIENARRLKSETGAYAPAKARFALHPPIPEKTGPRLIRGYAESALFFWFASKSMVARRGSLMTYHVEDGAVEAWFAAFSKNGAWRVANAQGIAPEAVAAMARCS